MTEHTPTTEQVRDYYALTAASPAKAYEEGLRDFDRFMAEVRREAAEKAWDEGAADVSACHDCEPGPNPYRQKGASNDRP